MHILYSKDRFYLYHNPLEEHSLLAYRMASITKHPQPMTKKPPRRELSLLSAPRTPFSFSLVFPYLHLSTIFCFFSFRYLLNGNISGITRFRYSTLRAVAIQLTIKPISRRNRRASRKIGISIEELR